MTVVFIASEDDIASLNMKKALFQLSHWNEVASFDSHPVFQNTKQQEIMLVTIQSEKIYHENLDKEIQHTLRTPVDQLVFLSRHTSKTGKPTLTVHAIGNYGPAEYGGKVSTLVPACPRLMTQVLRQIYTHHKKSGLNYEVCYEVTHHGPYVEVPTFFIEVGSTEKQWQQYVPAKIIAQSLLDIMLTHPYEHQQPKETTVLIGVGGGHYAPRFTDVILEKNAAFGHMIPSYQFEKDEIPQEMIYQALSYTPNVQGIYLHRKTLKKSQITIIKNMFKDSKNPVISSKHLPKL